MWILRRTRDGLLAVGIAIVLVGCWTMIIAVKGNGTTDPPPGRHTIGSAGLVTITAIPDGGWRFDHWEGDVESTDNPLQIEGRGGPSVTAVFVEDPRTYTLVLSVTGNGSLNIAPGTHTYPIDCAITLTATAEAGYRFDHWAGDVTGSTNPVSFFLDGNKSVEAIFVEEPKLTLSVTGPGSLNMPLGVHSYPLGTSIELLATPDTGNRFDHWDGDVTGSANPITVSMNADKTVGATFVELLPENATVDLGSDVILELVHLPAGSFMMGAAAGEYLSNPENEGPQHQVTFSHPVWVGKYEITKAQWEAVMHSTPWVGHDAVLDNPNSPAVCVTWDDAQSFITALNTLSGDTFRLLSEAEWEYACRAGTSTRFYWGNDLDNTSIGDFAWWIGNVDAGSEFYGHEVGTKHENSWGLFDMSGNVLEWCQDWYAYGDYPSGPVTDPTGPAEMTYGQQRVQRGGWWNSGGQGCRSAYRDSMYYLDSDSGTGFRVARTSYIDVLE